MKKIGEIKKSWLNDLDTSKQKNLSDIEGIVIYEMKYKESSKIVKIFTTDLGKITVMAKGILRSKSEMKATTLMLSKASYNLIKGKGDFYYIKNSELISLNEPLKKDFKRLSYSLFICSVMNTVLLEEQINKEAYQLLDKILEVLGMSDTSLDAIATSFLIKLPAVTGIMPVLKHCSVCGETLVKKPEIYFSVETGGFICDSCDKGTSFAYLLTADEGKYLYKALYMPIVEFSKQNHAANPARLHRMLLQFIQHHLEIDLSPSIQWLRRTDHSWDNIDF